MTATRDTSVQDVDPLNARIFFDGQVYVGGRRVLQRPDYFAPYFTAEAESQVPEVSERGISCVSRVFTAIEVEVANLRRFPEGVMIGSQTRNHSDWSNWERGLRAIAQRAITENWGISDDPRRVYFLLRPQALDHTIKKFGYLRQIPPGYGTSFARLKAAHSIRDLTL
jgi:hypothetical protein